MVKETQDMTGLNCLKGVSGKVTVGKKEIKRFVEGVREKTDE